MVLTKKGEMIPVRKDAMPFEWVNVENLDNVFERMRKDVERGFWDPFGGFANMPVFREPRIDMIDKGERIEIHADMPGISKDKVEIAFSEDGLEIRGEVEQEKKEEHKGYYHLERSSSFFYRKVTPPDGIKTEKAEASMDNGVLKIQLPKKERSKEHKRIEAK